MTKRSLGVVAAATVALLVTASAQASCIRQTAAQQRARADVIFDGVALDNPTPSGVQRFRVSRYVKGRGPTIVRVQTGNRVFADGSGSTTSISLRAVRKGQRWRIFAQGSPLRVLQTNFCAGSRRL
jgi:hypothetical protein